MVETAGVGVAERRVVAAEEMQAIGEEVFGTVSEAEGGLFGDEARSEEMGEVTVPGDPAEADDDTKLRQLGELRGEVPGAGGELKL